MKRVSVDGVILDARDWWDLSTRAQSEDVRVAELIARLVEAELHRPPAPKSEAQVAADVQLLQRSVKVTPEIADQIRALNGDGHSDASIGRRVGLDSTTVSRYRNALGLPRVERRSRKADAA